MIAAGLERFRGVPGRRQRPPGRRRGLLARQRIRAPRRGRVLLLLALLAMLGGAWLWLRDSPLVSVDRVTITGVSGPDAAGIRSALAATAHGMTTLDVRIDVLRTAVAPFRVVKDLRVSTQFPHGIRIAVLEQVPVGAVLIGGRTIAVAQDGTLLPDLAAVSELPQIPLSSAPAATRLTDPVALGATRALGAAPAALLARVAQVASVAPHGLVARLRSGPSIYLGDQGRLQAKWAAAIAVLADPGSVGAVYVDVTDPQRPAAGGVASPAGTAAPSQAQGGTTAGPIGG